MKIAEYLLRNCKLVLCIGCSIKNNIFCQFTADYLRLLLLICYRFGPPNHVIGGGCSAKRAPMNGVTPGGG